MDAIMSLRTWLDRLPEEHLDRVATLVPEEYAWTGTADLAVLLTHPAVVASAVRDLHLPAWQVLAVLMAMGDGADADRAAALLDPSALGEQGTRDAVGGAVSWLVDLALVWPDDGGGLRVNPGLRRVQLPPGPLGRPAAALLDLLPTDDLSGIAARWGVPGCGRRDHLLPLVSNMLSDPVAVRLLLSTAPDQAVAAVLDSVRQPAPARGAGLAAGAEPEDRRLAALDRELGISAARDDCARADGLAWAVRHGLMVWPGVGWRPEAPSEVSVALLPPGSLLPFTPVHPEVPSVEVPAERSWAEAGRAVRDFLAVLDAVLVTAAGAPVPVLRRRRGGVGVRQLDALARAVGAPAREVRFALEFAVELGLLGYRLVDDRPAGRRAGGRRMVGAYVTAPSAAAWRAAAVSDRMIDVLTVWDRAGRSPSRELDGRGRRCAAVTFGGYDDAAVLARQVLLWELGEFPAGHGMAGPAVLSRFARWRYPLIVDDDAEAGMADTWWEAERLGVVVDGAMTPVGHALLRRDRPVLAAALRALPQGVDARRG